MRILRLARFTIARVASAVLVATSLCASAAATEPTSEARSQLAPSGKLRVGLLVTNRAYVTKDGDPTEMEGVGVELGRELAKQLGVAFEPVRYRRIEALVDGARSGEWDVSPIGYSPDRRDLMDFTPLYTIARARYVVPADSTLRTVADIDQPKHRITVVGRSIHDAYLGANLKHAAVVRTKTFSEARELIGAGKAAAYFGSELTLAPWALERTDFRMLEGAVSTWGSALAIAKGRPAGLAHASAFIESAKASRFIHQALERNAQTDVIVAPAGASH